MSTPHNRAENGDFAKTVLMPGDPLRAKFIAETFLEDPRLVTDVRGMYGYTGTYQGRPISVMGSGMGMPSIGIYSYELYTQYGVENIIRIGSAGSYTDKAKLFDVVLAWGGFRLVRHFAPERPNRPLLCFCLLLLLPTVILNGAFWGHCDALYGALTLHALACALEGRNRSSLLLLGIAFSFKLQTVFVLPLWGGLWLLRRVRFRELLWFPAAYAATCAPALLLGKPLGDILGVYFGQAAEYSGYLNLNAPNMYALIPHGAEVNTALAARLGILAAFALAAAVLAALLVFRRQADDRALLAAAVVLAIGVPFLLPHMHERYFFLADVLALAWTCAFPRSAPCALLVELASLGAYVVVLRGKFTLAVSLDGRLFPMLCEALLMLAGLAFAVLSLARRLAFPQKSRE